MSVLEGSTPPLEISENCFKPRPSKSIFRRIEDIPFARRTSIHRRVR